MGSVRSAEGRRSAGESRLSPRRSLALVLAAALAYAAAIAAWLLAGFDRVYDAFVLRAASGLVPALTHFPIGSSEGIEVLGVQDRGYVLVLIAVLAFFAPLPWGSRLARYLPLAGFAVACHVVGLALQLHLGLGLETERRWGIASFLPWERSAIAWAAQLVFIVGLEVIAFVALVVTAWSRLATRASSPAFAVRPWARRLAAAGLVALVVAGVAAWWWREADARHRRMHAEVGRRFLERGMFEQAVHQYHQATRWGEAADQSWLGLVAALDGQGLEDEAKRRAREALETVRDPEARTRLLRYANGERAAP